VRKEEWGGCKEFETCTKRIERARRVELGQDYKWTGGGETMGNIAPLLPLLTS
jgi:hypothetical protein